MPTKPLERLMFVQGGQCFFCKRPLSKAEASVEHLFASSKGGSNSDENCVACCKSVNALLGSMSLKEKFQVVLNQNGHFKCPNGAGPVKTATPSQKPPAVRPQAKPKTPPKAPPTTPHITSPKVHPKAPANVNIKDDKLAFVIANLEQRGSSRPRTLKTLSSTVVSLYPKAMSETELAILLQQLQTTGKVIVKENKVTYAL